MKYVSLPTTVMVNGLPRGPNDGAQLMTDAQAQHLVDMRLIDPEAVEDAPDHSSPLDRKREDDAAPDGKTDKVIEKLVKARLKVLRAEDETKLRDALAAQQQKGDAAIDAELNRIREEGEAALTSALDQQKSEQDAAFHDRVAAAVEAALKEKTPPTS